MKRFLFAALVAVCFALAGCPQAVDNDTSSGGGAVTRAEFEALKASLRVQVVELHPAAAVAERRAMTQGIALPTAAPNAVTLAPATLGTNCGYDAPPPNATTVCVVNAQSITVKLPYPGGSTNDYSSIYPVYFDQAACQGNAYLPQGTISVPLVGGFVFRTDPFSKGDMDASTYYFLSATAEVDQVNPVSISAGFGVCQPLSTSTGPYLKLQPNTGTGWASQPTGPTGFGTP